MALLPISLLMFPIGTFPYAGAAFHDFVKESYRVSGRKDPAEFYRVMDQRAKAAGIGGWEDWIASHRSNGTDEGARAAGEAVWKRIKKTITKFDLDRGFEFEKVVTTGERQCYLQSIIVAGVLQRAGYDAGLAMVWKNPKGQSSNNGHAVAVVRGKRRDVVIDCSEPYPVEKHQGLFMRRGSGYQYLEPVYTADGWIEGYTRAGSIDEIALPTRNFAFLDLPFLRSQFDYYRGERAWKGILYRDKTAQGLAASEASLRKSLKECPLNPLPRAMLVKTLLAEGRTANAKAEQVAAERLYRRFGWTPDDVKRTAEAVR